MRFFKLIDSRLDKYRPPADQDFNNFVKKPQVFALVFWNWRYPPEVMDKLEKIFEQAMKKCDPKNFMVVELKVDFEYMRLTARAAHAAAAVQKDARRENMLKLADALEKRHDFINKLPRSRSNPNRITKYLGSPSIAALRAGGTMFGVFGPLFDISPEILRAENQNIDTVKVKDFADPAWEKIPANKVRGLKSHYPAVAASFKVAYNDEAILIKCQAPHPADAAAKVPRDSGKIWRDPVWEIFLGTSSLNRRQMVFSSAPGSAFDGTFYGNKLYVGWNGKWSHSDTVKDGIWYSCVTIPFKSVFGRVPRQGERILMQFGFAPSGVVAHYAFNIPFNGTFKEIRGFAKVRFGKKAASGTVRNADINGDFKVRDKNGFPAGWLVSPKRPGTVAKVGKEGITINKKDKDSVGLYSRTRIGLDEGEECVFTAVVQGKGMVNLGAGWHRGDGDFAVNAGGGRVKLTGREQRLTWRFDCGINAVREGAWAFQPVIFITSPDSTVTVKNVDIKIISK